MGYTLLITGLVLIVAAWACYQYPNLINPYGNMSPEQKELVNIEGLKKAVALILGPTGFLLVVTATLHLLKVIDEDVCGVTLMVLVLAMMVPLSIAMKRYNAFGRDQSKSNIRFVRDEMPLGSDKSGKLVKSAKAARIAWGFALVIVVLAALTLALSFRPTRITVGEETIKISGMYGREIPVSDIVSVDLLDEMPPIAMRTNGSDTGKQAKGHFRFSNGEHCMLFIHKEAPFIQLRTTNELYYLNLSDKEKTLELFETLKESQP
ncbi:MAG: DUF3784 domain-containing protein [Bacteroidales bacterium]|nr:DUF3784 domain-containing protein [Bacteroidales bacterium]